jgi:hypothetical protein
LLEARVYQRVKQNGSASQFLDASDSEEGLPVAGNPPLTRDIVDKETQYFEWLLDVQLTIEQRAEFRDTLAGIWKTHRQGAIDAMLNFVKAREFRRAGFGSRTGAYRVHGDREASPE